MTSVDLTGWDVSSVENMAYLFYGCTNLTEINISNWNTSKVKNMSFMFGNLSNMEELDISNLNTKSVTNFQKMFNGSTKLKHIYVGENWDTSANEGDATEVFPASSELPNFSSENENYRNLSYAHTGEGGYLTFKLN